VSDDFESPLRRVLPGRGGRVALYAANLAVIVFLFAPLAVIVLVSFSAGAYLTFPPRGFTWAWYGRMLGADGFLESLWLSARLGAAVAVLSLALGTTAALGLAGNGLRGRTLLTALVLSPLVVPSLVTRIAHLQFFRTWDVRSPFWMLLVGHVVITVPYVIRTVGASLDLFDWSLVDTARVLGAGPVRAFLRVTLPLIRPGIAAGGIFAFLVSFDNFTISMFLHAAEYTPLPIRLFQYMEAIMDPTVAAISAFLIFLSFCILIATERLVGIRRIGRL
jgi:putative spermidine/putrescine transport system permease protein